jgi:hypothetical protein
MHMKIKSHLKLSSTPPLVGRESFDTFLQVAEALCSYAVDDLSLSVQNDRLKCYVCWVDPKDADRLDKLLARYASMRLAAVWVEKAFTESVRRGLYYSLGQLDGGDWQLQYGLTDGQDLYVVGQFAFDADLQVPVSSVTKHFRQELLPFSPKTYSLLNLARKGMKAFSPGPCSLGEPQVVDGSVIIQAHMLGVWDRDQTLVWAKGEPEKYVRAFQEFVAAQPWGDKVELVLKVIGNGYAAFIVKPRAAQAQPA